MTTEREIPVLRHRLSPEVAAKTLGHMPREIHAGDRYDRILRRLLDGINWAEKNPAWCRREWTSATALVLAALSPELVPDDPEIRHLPISTYVSGCRLHLGDRWPGMDIDRRPVRAGRRGMNEYRIASRAEIAARKDGEAHARRRRGTRLGGAGLGTAPVPRSNQTSGPAPSPMLFDNRANATTILRGRK